MALEKTGERMIEELYQSNPEDYLIYLLHKATYRFALDWAKNMKVLDLGCGSGYGTEMLADHCQFIVGSDIDAHAITYAKEHYSRQNLTFFVMDNLENYALPFEANTFDVIVSFQVIEHISNVNFYLQEISRLLKVDGTIILATPDRSKRLFSFQKPWNRWHVHEFSDRELHQLLTQFFNQVEILKMGGKQEMMRTEIKRTHRMKWLTLPFTVPFVPASFRIWGLNLLKTIKAKNRTGKISVSMSELYHEEDISISESEVSSVNLIAIARQSKNPTTR